MHHDECNIKNLYCKFDGMCQPVNPGGIACYGFIIQKKNNKFNKIYEGAGIAFEPFSKESSNNVAEYVGLIKALEWLFNNRYNKSIIFIQGDSQLIINQLCGKYRVRSEKLMFYYERTKTLIKNFENLQIEWIARDKNKEADDLANKAYIDFIDKNYEHLYNKLKPHFATDQQINLLRHLKINPSRYLSRIEANRFLKKYNKKK
ncbi:MAG TPA: ribonuclease HI [Nitrososphaeraceae archaeon]|nr:ribonuclease HI [Nitrososphaeraceae archaeon]